MMKWTAFFLCAAIMQVSANSSYSQNVTLNSRNVSLAKVFNQIKRQTGLSFLWDEQLLRNAKPVTIAVKDQPIEKVLEQCLANQPLTYDIKDKLVIIKEKRVTTSLVNSLLAMAAQPVKGLVTDAKGNALPGASVAIKGTGRGVITDVSGSFSLSASPGDSLEISMIGYGRKTIAVTAATTTVNIVLQEDESRLSEMVVVGYATQKKVNVLGAVTSIGGEDIKSRPITNVSSALAGLGTGVSVMQGSGKPGSDGATIRVRGWGSINEGANGALVIIDGIQGSLDALNPEDIESISILKDAGSAAIYGALAANGVILVTTKKGTRDRTTVTYSGIFSTQSPSNYIPVVTNYAQHMRLINEGFTNLGQNAQFAQSTIDLWEAAAKAPNDTNALGVPNWLAYPNTDWADVVFDNNIMQNHNVSVSGGGDKVVYLLSAGYLKNPGVMRHTGIERYQVRANVEAKINKVLSIGTQTFASFQTAGLGNTENAFNFLRQTTPGVYPYYKGKYGFAVAAEESSTANNILTYLDGTAGDNTVSRFNSTWYAKVNIIKGLTLDSKINYQTRFAESSYHPVLIERWNFAANELKAAATTADQLTTTYRYDKDYTVTIDHVLRYATQIGKHDLAVLAGYNQFYYNYYNLGTDQRGLIDASITTPGSATTMLSIIGGENDRAMSSVFGRINYSFNDKYLLEANLRYDGSSKFNPDVRWGLFPSFSAGWRISEESFMKGLNEKVQNLKLRAGWGILGNNAGSGDYSYMSNYGVVYYSYNGVPVSGLRQGSWANPGIRWESGTTANIGVDGLLLKGDLKFDLDLYRKLSYDILTNPPVSLTGGTASAPVINGPKLINNGIELALDYRKKIGEVEFSVGGNVAYNQSRVEKYKGRLKEGYVTDASGNKVYNSNIGSVSANVSGANTRILEGYQQNEYYLLDVYKGNGSYKNADGSVNVNGGPKDGMVRTPADLEWLQLMTAAGYTFQPAGYTTPVGGAAPNKARIYYGDLIYADRNGDGIYGNSYDYSFQDVSTIPKWIYGFHANAAYKGIDFSMIWAGAAGFKYYFNVNGMNNSIITNGVSIAEHVANDHYYFNEANPADPNNNINGKYPRLKNTNDAQNNAASTFWLYNASYLKLKNLQIGYTLPERISRRALISRARVFLSGENLFMFTKYPGMDPEIGAGINYPTMKQFAGGVNVTF